MDLLVIGPNNINALKKKGVIKDYNFYNEGGYFEKIIALFPLTKDDMTYSQGSNVLFFQYGWHSRYTSLNNLKIVKFFGTLVIIYKLIFIFRKNFKKFNIKVIRAPEPNFIALIGLFYSYLYKIPLIVSVHSDYDQTNLTKGFSLKILGSRMLSEKLECFIYNKADAIFPISNYIKMKILNKYQNLNKCKFYLFPNAIDIVNYDNVNKIDIHKTFNISKKNNIICYVGRLSLEKFSNDLPLIIEHLKFKLKRFIFLIIGDGNEFKNLQKQLANKNLQKYVKMVGFQSREIVYNSRKIADVNVCLYDGVSLIEAALSEKPVVAYDVEWHRELIKHNKTGCLVSLHNQKSMADNIANLISNKKKAVDLGKNLRKLTMQKHEIGINQQIKRKNFENIIFKFSK